MNSLILRYQHDPDPGESFGRLTLVVNGSGFSGAGSMWVQWQDVEAFAAALGVFPLPREPAVGLQFGFNQMLGDDLRLKIKIYPSDSRGNLKVDMMVADYVEPAHRIKTTFNTQYPQVDTFRAEIGRVLKGDLDEAVLHGF